MKRYSAIRAFVVGVALTLGGCADLFGPATPDEAPAATATLFGAKQYEDDPAIGDSYTYPVAIDGRTIGQGRLGWDDPIEVAPGWHTIRFGISRGASYSGFGEAQANLATGRTYKIQATRPIPYAINVLASDGWVEDDAGASISNRTPVKLVLLEENNGLAPAATQP